MPKQLYIPNEDGVFESPLGSYDQTAEKWSTMVDFLEDVFTKMHPNSKITEAKTGRVISYSHLFASGQNIAKQLRESGVADRTILHMVGENCLDWLAVLIGSHLSDCIIAATHPNSPWPEVDRNIRTTCSTVLVMTRKCYEKFSKEIDHAFLTSVIITDASGNGDTFELKLTSIPCEQKSEPQYDKSELVGVCQMLLSSGTSGSPKAIRVSPRMIMNSGIITSAKGVLSCSKNDVSLVAQPLAHAGGQNFAFLAVAFNGPDLLVTDYPGTTGLLEMLQKYKLTHIFAVPAVVNAMAKVHDLETYDLSSLKCLMIGGSTPNFEMIQQIMKRSNVTSFTAKNVFGISECANAIFISNDFLESSADSVGVSLPSISFKIVDLENRSKVITEPNIEGELLLKQFYPHLLYFNDPKKTADSLTEDGFYTTGDFARLDETFNLYICGRIKDVVKYRGFSVSPAEIEEVLMENDLIDDCSVVAKPDEKCFEIPVAFVVLSDKGKAKTEEETSKELIEFVAKSVAEHKQLRGVYVIDKIPRNGNGKILKRELRGALLK